MSSSPTPPVLDLFCDLAALPTPPGRERAAADRVGAYLTGLGLAWDEDGAGVRLGGDTGNLYCRLEPTVPGTPIFLCAHLDTVPPTAGIEPVVEDGVVRNAAGTILGADNKAAVAVMLEAVRRIVEEGVAHAGVELLFTPQEETGLLGAVAFDHRRLAAADGFVFDQHGPIGQIVVAAPALRALEFRFRGRAAHAGMAPEEGRSAVVAAGRALVDLRLGRLDEETTANVGVIQGGVARNIVPDQCTLVAEARSHDPRRLAALVGEMLETVAFAATVSDCTVESEVTSEFEGYRFRADDTPVRLADAALRACGFVPEHVLTGGGADANVFNQRGLRCVNLSNGMADIHTPDEHVAVADLEAMVGVTLGIVAAARDAAHA